jgi:formylglycine-generating enzyme required for sulfatase activity
LIKDDFGIAMVFVPEGPFSLGSVNGDPDEKPVVEIYLKSFYIDQFEVSNASYKECVDQGICTLPRQNNSRMRLEYYGAPEFANYPVLYVSWNDAATYCEWRGARLPSEAEWEKAARGPDGWLYPWGNVFEEGRANYCGGSEFCPGDPDDGYQDTAPVDAFARGLSPYGAYQMAGNVNEWVADWYDKNYYRSLEEGAENPLGPEQGQERGIRGGSFGLNTEKIRTTNRGSAIPSQTSEYDGFRCALDLPGP